MVENTKENASFTWLHLTDLHVGMQNQSWLWLTFKTQFFEDLKTVHAFTGPIDTVIFSGDLTQHGTREEYDRLDKILADIWDVLKKEGSTPNLLVMPGNHDVQWVEKLPPELQVLKQWWKIPDIHEDFFADADNVYRRATDQQLLEYRNWLTRKKEASFPLLTALEGFLPGDLAATHTTLDFSVGLISLNSTWLQVDKEDYFKRLHVDARQLQRITNDDPSAWCAGNDLNLLITHHPVDWLHEDSQEFWESDINPAGRFDVHLHGHMHTPAAQSLSLGGASAKRTIQGASLFGLKQVSTTLERVHGYNVGKAVKSNGKLEVRVWPRILETLQGKEKALRRDQSFNVRESDGSYQLCQKDLSSESDATEDDLKSEQSTSLQLFSSTYADEILRKVRYHLPLHIAHMNVRRVEQQRCVEALSEYRACWIVSDWGMGEDGFLSSVRFLRNQHALPTYRLDLSDLTTTKEQLYETIRGKLDCSLGGFCDLLANTGPNYLIFDNISVTANPTTGTVAPENDLEEVISIILDYCPGLNIFIKSRRAPKYHQFPVINIQPLDVADLRTYISEHEKGGSDRASSTTVGAIHRLTDGIPIRVDQALKHLGVVTLSELITTNSDLLIVTPAGGDFDPGLIRALRELADTSDQSQQRSFALLKALLVFPQGEQLSRIKRFNFNAPFHLKHAEELLDHSLIEITTLQRINSNTSDTQARTLVVPRQTRECLRELIDAEEFRELNRKAADLYFGEGWQAGIVKAPTSYRFDNPNCPSGDILNGGTIIIRLFNDALDQNDDRDILRSLGLAQSFVSSLGSGDHFNSAVTFCEQLLPQIPEDRYEEQRSRLLAEYGTSLRMAGDRRKARDVLVGIADYKFATRTQQSVLLNLALCFQGLEYQERAKEYALAVIALDRHSNAALHAQAVLIEIDVDDPKRSQKLIAHENKCRRQKANVAANNIALLRAREAAQSQEQIREILAPVMRISKDNKDHYNQTRAVIQLSKLSLDANQSLGEKELSQLISSYYFLFNERLPSLFDRCHDALWRSFENSGNKKDLLELFRHSSLFWRLRGQEANEGKYISSLVISHGQQLLASKLDTLNREEAYLSMRARSSGMLTGPQTRTLPPAKG